MPPSQKRPSKQKARVEARETRLSLAFYFALTLLAGQFVARVVASVPFDWLLLSGTFAIVLGVLFGPTFVIEFFRAIRGSKNGDSGEDDAQ